MGEKKGVDKADLLELENKINDKQQEARHGQNNLIQVALNKSDEAITENKLLKQSLDNMNKEFKELKEETKDGFDKLEKKFDDFIEKLDKTYVKEEKFTTLKEDFSTMKKTVYGIASMFILAILGFLGNILWQIILNYKG